MAIITISANELVSSVRGKINTNFTDLDSRLNTVQLINKTGAPSIKGTVVSASTTTDLAFVAQANEFDAIGIVAENGKADGASTTVIVSGIADVLLANGTASTRGNWVKCSTVDGRADATLSAPSGGTIQAIDDHFKEIGHCLESKTAGTDVMCKILLHFN